MAKLVFHHSSLAKGYVCKGCGWTENYRGIFGVGEKRHIPNNIHKVDSNRFHIVEYWIRK